MSLWTTVSSTPEVKVSLFENMNEQRSPTPNTVLSDHAVEYPSPITPTTSMAEESNPRSLRAKPSPPAERTQVDDVDMVETGIPAVDDTHGDETATRLPPNSRFATLGLNAGPLERADRKHRSPAKSIHTEKQPPTKRSFQRNWMQDEEDLTELETLLIPVGLRQAYRDGGALPMDPRPLVSTIKMSRYSTGFLTESGWHAINNDQWDIASKQKYTDQDTSGAAPVDECVNYDDLPGKLAKLNPVIEEPLSKSDFDATVAELPEYAEMPLVHEKYFDLDHYMEHAQPAYRRPTRKGGPAKSPRIEMSHGAPTLEISSPIEQSLGAGNGIIRKGTHLPISVKNKTNALQQAIAGPNTPGGDSSSAADKRTLQLVSEADAVASFSDEGNTSGDNTGSAAFSVGDNRVEKGGTDGVEQKGKWELINEDTATLRLDQPAPEKLTIRLRQIETGKVESHTFQKLSHFFIDWSNKSHIREITKWWYHVLHRRGIHLKRTHTPYVPEEEAWLSLFHKKVKLNIEAGHNIQLPGPIPTLEAFNEFFLGKVLQDPSGEDLPPRGARDEISIKGKLYHGKSGIKSMRDVIRKLLEGKHGGVVYVPIITEDELKQYREDGTVIVDDPGDAERNTMLTRSSPKRKREVHNAGGSNRKRIKQ
jgi:hypothetical protein